MVRAVLVVGSVALAVGGCSGSPVADPATTSSPATAVDPLPVDFSAPGPYPVGMHTLVIEDEECGDAGSAVVGCPRTAVVFYPADPDSAGSSRRVTGYSTSLAMSENLRAFLPVQLVQQVELGLDAFEAPAANREGPFPVVLHSHDDAGFHRFESRWMAHLASWGFVVAAPDDRERGTSGRLAGVAVPPGSGEANLGRTFDALRTANVDGGVLHGALDPSRLSVTGHGTGAIIVRRFAAELESRTIARGESGSRVAAMVAKAPVVGVDDGFTAAEPDVRSAPATLVLLAEADGTAPVDRAAVPAQGWGEPLRVVVLRNAGHNTFTDLCDGIRNQGGFAPLAAELPALAGMLTAAQDGCTPDRVEPGLAEAVVDHLTIAHLRWVLGMDRTDASLQEPFLLRQFPELVVPGAKL